MKKQCLMACLTTTAAVLLLSLTACRSDETQRRVVTPADFTTHGGQAQADTASPDKSQTAAVDTTPAAGTQTSPSDSSENPSDDAAQNAQNTTSINTGPKAGSSNESGDGTSAALPLDAMVGQVNGKAIYARTVFEPIEPQLAALGRTLPPSVFKQRATELIVGQLQTLVTNALILGEAERDLSKQEQFGLLSMLQSRREELLRQFGSGSAAVADEVSRSRTGKDVDERVDEFRQQVLVGRYINTQVRTKINVSRKDIERYYDLHRAEYNPPPGRTVRLIMTRSDADADHLEKLLASGTSFDEVAKSKANQYRPAQGGLMADRITGDRFSGFDELNQAMVKLKAGEHSPRLEVGGSFWWVKVETFDSGKGRSLEEVQIEIRDLLENQQRNALGTAFRQKLLEEGSYNPVGEMADSLIQIAMSRYSQPLEN